MDHAGLESGGPGHIVVLGAVVVVVIVEVEVEVEVEEEVVLRRCCDGVATFCFV